LAAAAAGEGIGRKKREKERKMEKKSGKKKSQKSSPITQLIDRYAKFPIEWDNKKNEEEKEILPTNRICRGSEEEATIITEPLITRTKCATNKHICIFIYLFVYVRG
jgi:hypothetical protein